MNLALNRPAGCGTVLQRVVGLFVFLLTQRNKDMRELSVEELDVVVGGMPIIVEL